MVRSGYSRTRSRWISLAAAVGIGTTVAVLLLASRSNHIEGQGAVDTYVPEVATRDLFAGADIVMTATLQSVTDSGLRLESKDDPNGSPIAISLLNFRSGDVLKGKDPGTVVLNRATEFVANPEIEGMPPLEVGRQYLLLLVTDGVDGSLSKVGVTHGLAGFDGVQPIVDGRIAPSGRTRTAARDLSGLSPAEAVRRFLADEVAG